MPEHQTVGWLIKLLQEYPKDLKVQFATGPGENLCLLSDYILDDSKTLCIDIGSDDDV